MKHANLLLFPTPQPTKRRRIEYSPGFSEFWKVYPPTGGRKSGKPAAFQAWLEKDCEPYTSDIVAAVKRQKRAQQRIRDGGGWTPQWPYAERYIKRSGWNDEVTE